MNKAERAICDFFAGERDMPEAYWSLAKTVNWLFAASRKEKIKALSPLKLQKMLYLMNGICLREKGRPLIREHAQAWKYGAVFPEAYHEYKEFGVDCISLGTLYYMGEKQEKNNTIIKVKPYPEDNPNQEELGDMLRQTIIKYKKFNGIELSNLTHRNDADNPIIKAREISTLLNIENIPIPHVRIMEYFNKNCEW